MTSLSSLRTGAFADFDVEVARDLSRCLAFDQAADHLTRKLYEKFSRSIALARVFITVPYQQLPEVNRAFVDRIATDAGVERQIQPDTLVLSLAGTHGIEEAWNHPWGSHSHLGIPLVSTSFVETIPMMSRLLKELGLGIDWIDQGDTEIVSRVLGNYSALFYVPDAATEVDHGQHPIAAQDFVADYGIRTVFGLGGAYIGSATFVTCIVFCMERIERSKAQLLLPLINRLKVATNDLVRRGRVFGGSEEAGLRRVAM